jgi:hypothetical protein
MTVTNQLPAALHAGGTNDLRDIKPPVEIPSGWAWLIWFVAALTLALLAWWAWRYWQKRRAAIPPVPVVPPHIRAKEKLQQALALLSQPREFCIMVSDAIRWYLEERFDFRAPERTTEEFLHELQATSLLSPDQKTSLGDFLARCDLVKFARYEPGEPELRDLQSSALRLVDETEPRPEPVTTSGSSDTPAQPPASSPVTVPSPQP